MTELRDPFCLRALLVGCILLLSACDEPKVEEPAPLPEMTEHNKRAYSTTTFSAISGFEGRLRDRFEEEHGQLSMQNYQVSSDFPFDKIVDHYNIELGTAGGWAKVEESSLTWAAGSNGAGWRNKKSVFLVFAVTPDNAADMMPVYTLSNLKEISTR